ncbi:MAG TPA: (E)-4-hydroxy-3-methylbut-2-enyl-diphosphate synthase [Candidatus Avirikenella pullistercoris]|nr:(E)-4-hydroxy-3-methylbut-2-enyl-diphosphate synthase [Candidatus Avirikenella pullistercoris]
MTSKYCESLSSYSRRETRPVKVGNVVIGGGGEIVVQSMCTTDTMDTEGSVCQAIRIADAGGEMVRYTAQGRREAENLKNIRQALRDAGYDVPLVADIHFNPVAAEIAACNVEKVRINPGNFIDKRANFSVVEYTEEEYAAELERLKQKLCRLLDICVEHGTALRIGVNHGSLSDRIMSRYGDTPEGMVASAMEFLNICREYGFGDVVISMKSSNTKVMVRAYRLMAAALREQGMDYPLHLGVTEAGEGEDGRIKSAVGIGALLNDGLGDTIRVSLTEAPENEIPVARKLADYYRGRETHSPFGEVSWKYYEAYEDSKRDTMDAGGIGGKNLPVVIAEAKTAFSSFGGGEFEPDFIYVEGNGKVGKRVFGPSDITTAEELAPGKRFISLTLSELNDRTTDYLERYPNKVVILKTFNKNGPAEQRAFFLKLKEKGIRNAVVIHREYDETDMDSLTIKAAADCGMLFIDGMGDGIWLQNKNETISPVEIVRLSFGILQAARARITKTEYISCPGCGRTLYSLQETLKKIKEKTAGLKGLKIAVMGCIVNGPGEMADADYGYVGSGKNVVTLYKGKEVIKRNIPQENAIDELVALIKENGEYRI